MMKKPKQNQNTCWETPQNFDVTLLGIPRCASVQLLPMILTYIPYVNYTSVLKSYITNILLFLSIITPEQTFEVPVPLILGFSKEVSDHIFHGSLPLHWRKFIASKN